MLLQHLCHDLCAARFSSWSTPRGTFVRLRVRCTGESRVRCCVWTVPPRQSRPTWLRPSTRSGVWSGRERCAGCVILFTNGDLCTTMLYRLHSTVTLAPPRHRQRHATRHATRRSRDA